MTPKEKATALVDKYYEDDLMWEDLSYIQAKKCASIAVDELILSHNKWDDYAQTNSEEYYYWQEVKQEIEKL